MWDTITITTTPHPIKKKYKLFQTKIPFCFKVVSRYWPLICLWTNNGLNKLSHKRGFFGIRSEPINLHFKTYTYAKWTRVAQSFSNSIFKGVGSFFVDLLVGPYTTYIQFQSIINFIRTRNVRQHRQSPGRAHVTKVKSAHADDIFIHRPHSSLSDAMTDRRAAPNAFDGQSLTRRGIRG